MVFRKEDFPFFKAHPELTYLDSAATSQKPESVIRAISDFYAHHNASAYRGLYKIAEEATQMCETVRASCADFIDAQPDEIAFTAGATDGINTVARAWAEHALEPGDEILISELEHHANILVWQELARRKNLILKRICIDQAGMIRDHAIDTLITERTKFVALTAHSHVLGNLDALTSCRYPDGFSAHIIQKAHAFGARVLIDAAQYAPHARLSVKKLGCDFLVFSAHKMLGPQGLGILYVARDLHEHLHPCRFGGGMTTYVDYAEARMQPFPRLLEAGTQPIAHIAGLGAALDYLKHVDFDALRTYEAHLCTYFAEAVRANSAVRILNMPTGHHAQHLLSFIVDGMHAHDVAAYLDTHGVCVRAGAQCAQILHKKLAIPGSVRVSFYGYNTAQDVERIVRALSLLKNK